MKRFYKEVNVGHEAGGFTVLLDGKPVRTPARAMLSLPREPLAAAVADEWQAQGESIRAADMPLTKLATTVVDLMPARRGDAIAEAATFAGTDLLCYRAARPDSLVLRQATVWQPWLDWAAREYAARLVLAPEVMPVEQPADAVTALQAAVERLDDWRLVGLHAATTLLGSIVLGLAMERGALDAERAFAAGLLDELYEIEQWGEDAEQAQRHARIKRDLVAAERFLRLLG